MFAMIEQLKITHKKRNWILALVWFYDSQVTKNQTNLFLTNCVSGGHLTTPQNWLIYKTAGRLKDL